jgi:hypothetical protein
MHSAKNGLLDTTIETFTPETSDSNSTVFRGRIDQTWVSGPWTLAPFATYMFRDHNTYDPVANQFVAAKTMWSGGSAVKYAANAKLTVGVSLERFWATELADSGTGEPDINTRGWRAILTGSYTF